MEQIVIYSADEPDAYLLATTLTELVAQATKFISRNRALRDEEFYRKTGRSIINTDPPESVPVMPKLVYKRASELDCVISPQLAMKLLGFNGNYIDAESFVYDNKIAYRDGNNVIPY